MFLEAVEIDLRPFAGEFRPDPYASVRPWAHGQPEALVDGDWKNEAFRVVGVIADEVHPAGRAHHEDRRFAELLDEARPGPLFCGCDLRHRRLAADRPDSRA